MRRHVSDVNVMEKNIGKSLFEGDREKIREKGGAALEAVQSIPDISPRAVRLIERIALLDGDALEKLIEQLGCDGEP